MRLALAADLPLTGWTVFPLPLASLGPLCLPPAGGPEAPAAAPSPAAAPPANPGCPAPAAVNASACADAPAAGRFDPATDGGVLYRRAPRPAAPGVKLGGHGWCGSRGGTLPKPFGCQGHALRALGSADAAREGSCTALASVSDW